MTKFSWGIVFTLIVIAIFAYVFVHGGYLDIRADNPPSPVEKKFAMHAMDESIERHAPHSKNPLQPTNETLIAGAKSYRDNCAGCHGNPTVMDTQLGDSFNPPAPQFWMDSPDMPENENFYIIKHGIHWTGMPAWGKKLDDTQIWQVVTLLSHLDKLPDSVNQELQKQGPAAP
jgi:mono/diheme cytochrome c family protein